MISDSFLYGKDRSPSEATLFCAKDQKRNNSPRNILFFFHKPASKISPYYRAHI